MATPSSVRTCVCVCLCVCVATPSSVRACLLTLLHTPSTDVNTMQTKTPKSHPSTLLHIDKLLLQYIEVPTSHLAALTLHYTHTHTHTHTHTLWYRQGSVLAGDRHVAIHRFEGFTSTLYQAFLLLSFAVFSCLFLSTVVHSWLFSAAPCLVTHTSTMHTTEGLPRDGGAG
jgi:hypothetical protein